MAKDKDKISIEEERMAERARKREKKRLKEMPVSGKEVFKLKKIKEEKVDEKE